MDGVFGNIEFGSFTVVKNSFVLNCGRDGDEIRLQLEKVLHFFQYGSTLKS